MSEMKTETFPSNTTSRTTKVCFVPAIIATLSHDIEAAIENGNITEKLVEDVELITKPITADQIKELLEHMVDRRLLPIAKQMSNIRVLTLVFVVLVKQHFPHELMTAEALLNSYMIHIMTMINCAFGSFKPAKKDWDKLVEILAYYCPVNELHAYLLKETSGNTESQCLLLFNYVLWLGLNKNNEEKLMSLRPAWYTVLRSNTIHCLEMMKRFLPKLHTIRNDYPILLRAFPGLGGHDFFVIVLEQCLPLMYQEEMQGVVITIFQALTEICSVHQEIRAGMATVPMITNILAYFQPILTSSDSLDWIDLLLQLLSLLHAHDTMTVDTPALKKHHQLTAQLYKFDIYNLRIHAMIPTVFSLKLCEYLSMSTTFTSRLNSTVCTATAEPEHEESAHNKGCLVFKRSLIIKLLHTFYAMRSLVDVSTPQKAATCWKQLMLECARYFKVFGLYGASASTNAYDCQILSLLSQLLLHWLTPCLPGKTFPMMIDSMMQLDPSYFLEQLPTICLHILKKFPKASIKTADELLLSNQGSGQEEGLSLSFYQFLGWCLLTNKHWRAVFMESIVSLHPTRKEISPQEVDVKIILRLMHTLADYTHCYALSTADQRLMKHCEDIITVWMSLFHRWTHPTEPSFCLIVEECLPFLYAILNDYLLTPKESSTRASSSSSSTTGTTKESSNSSGSENNQNNNKRYMILEIWLNLLMYGCSKELPSMISFITTPSMIHRILDLIEYYFLDNDMTIAIASMSSMTPCTASSGSVNSNPMTMMLIYLCKLFKYWIFDAPGCALYKQYLQAHRGVWILQSLLRKYSKRITTTTIMVPSFVWTTFEQYLMELSSVQEMNMIFGMDQDDEDEVRSIMNVSDDEDTGSTISLFSDEVEEMYFMEGDVLEMAFGEGERGGGNEKKKKKKVGRKVRILTMQWTACNYESPNDIFEDWNYWSNG